jgi:hypothetical protein
MSLAVADSDVILDVTGKPVGIDVAMFLKALDRLLTVGAYYSNSHEQYHRAAETQCAAMVAAIRPNPSLSIEVAAGGLIVGGSTVDPHLRVARQVHDLLVSLNVACLEVSVRLTPADLRQAIAALQAHRLEFGHAQSFRAITIENMPATVSVSSRRVTSIEDDDETFDSLLDSWSEGTGPAAFDFSVQGPVRADFLRDLMAVLQEASDNINDDASATDAAAAGAHRQAVISREELEAIQDGVQRLLQRDPDANEIANLMALARQALELSGDPEKARLVFDQLRKRVGDEDGPGARLLRARADHVWTVDELAGRTAELAGRPTTLPEPVAAARRDQLAIGFRLLAAGARDPGFEASLAVLHKACGSREFGTAEAAVFASAIVTLANLGRRDVIDRVLPRLLPEIRATRPDLLAQIWSGVDANLAPPALALLWPHLANDVFLGLESATESVLIRCLLLAGGLDIDTALEQLPRLATLPGAERQSPPEQIFMVAPLRARCLHAALLRTAAAERHAQRLYRELRRRPPDALTGIVTAAVEDGEAIDSELLQVLVREGGHKTSPPALVELATALLLEAIPALHVKRRREAWLAAAITWLGATSPGRSRELLQRIRTEKKWLVRAAWPDACRAAADAALAANGQVG